MKKKLVSTILAATAVVSVLFAVMVLIVSIPKYSFAAESGKVIFINMNRTTIKSMQDIPSLKAELEKRGYMGLMNIRGDKGTDDKRSLASMGAGGRANLACGTPAISPGSSHNPPHNLCEGGHRYH